MANDVQTCQSNIWLHKSFPFFNNLNNHPQKKFTFISTTLVKSEQNINAKRKIFHFCTEKDCILPTNGNNVSNGISRYMSLLKYFRTQVYLTKNF